MTDLLEIRKYRAAHTGQMLLYVAVCWPPGDEAKAKHVWERSMHQAKNTHSWRIQNPRTGQHIVVVLGAEETRPVLKKALQSAREQGGGKPYDCEADFLEALALRRTRMIAERLEKQDFGLKVIRNQPRKLDRSGRMTDA